MIKLDEDALICDLAETYHIYDYRSLSASTVATLAAGLRDNARIIQKINGVKGSTSDLLLALIADRLFMDEKMTMVNSLRIKKERQYKFSHTSVEEFDKIWVAAGGGIQK